MTIDEHTSAPADQALRDRATKRLKKRRDFYGHLLVYTLINTFVIVIWLLTDPHGFFWPVFPIVGWGIAVILNAWDVFGPAELDEQAIEREMERLRK